MEVRDGMSGVVLTVGPGHTLREAAQKMTEREVGAAVVIDEELPAPGVLSERDILISLGKGQDPDSERVGDHFSDTIISRLARLEPRARGDGDVPPPHPPPRRSRGRRAGRRPLDARHHARLDVRRRDVIDDVAGVGSLTHA